MAHKDICIKFEVEWEPFEAVGVLNDGEPPISGDTTLERVPDAIGEEDEVFLWRLLSKLPRELRQYYLATARRHPNCPHYVACFGWDADDGMWYQVWLNLGRQWDGRVLVLRRGKKEAPETETN